MLFFLLSDTSNDQKFQKATAAIEASSKNFEHLLVPNSENGRVRLHVLEMVFELVSNNHSIFNPILNKIISLATKVIILRVVPSTEPSIFVEPLKYISRILYIVLVESKQRQDFWQYLH